jgi:hypothetical protein
MKTCQNMHQECRHYCCRTVRQSEARWRSRHSPTIGGIAALLWLTGALSGCSDNSDKANAPSDPVTVGSRGIITKPGIGCRDNAVFQEYWDARISADVANDNVGTREAIAKALLSGCRPFQGGERGLVIDISGIFTPLSRIRMDSDGAAFWTHSDWIGQERVAMISPTTQAIPDKLGVCINTSIVSVGTRLENVPGSGSAVTFSNGAYQVSYDTVAAVEQSRAGDPVNLCLVSIPENCPPGDDRGREFKTTNLRTGQVWTLPDSSHQCGGA